MKTLEQLLKEQKSKKRVEAGDFGIIACKESIQTKKQYLNKSYYMQLEEYVYKANTDIFFNETMILACWELINENKPSPLGGSVKTPNYFQTN